MFNYADYARQLRHELHQIPEIGFDLPKTTAVVKRELEAMGLPYTEKYGKSSIVTYINPEKEGFTIALRADMDALPIQEASNNPFPSQHEGKMHACGHDAHTAILLATGRRLQDLKDSLTCRVKLLFTPAEEYIEPGCKQMAENGVMDDIDCIISLHVDKDFEAGTVCVESGGQGANSMGFTVEFVGNSSHAASQHRGKDAIAMAVQAYTAMEIMVAKEINPVEPCLLNIGSIHGGTTNNVICNSCKMFGSSRSHNDEVSAYLIKRIREICQSVAQCSGGEATVEVVKYLPYVINNEIVSQKVYESAVKVLGAENVVTHRRRLMGGEDFSFLCRKKPGMMFRLGTSGDDPNTHLPGHTDHFSIDERAIGVGVGIFTQFVLDNMNGIEGL